MSPFTPDVACSSQLVSFFATCGKSKHVPRHSLSLAVSAGHIVSEKNIHLPPCFHPEEKGKGSTGTWPGQGKKSFEKDVSQKNSERKRMPSRCQKNTHWKSKGDLGSTTIENRRSGRNKLCREDPEVISRIFTSALFAYVKVYYLSTYGGSGHLLFLVCGGKKGSFASFLQ